MAEQAIGRALHVQHVLGMRADAAQDAEHGLDEQRRLDEPALEEMREVVEMRGVVALELEAGAGVAERTQHELDVLEGVAEHEIARILQRLPLPVVLEVLEAVEHRKQAEIHRAHVERSDFRLEDLGRLHALLHGHVGRAARRQVHDRVRSPA